MSGSQGSLASPSSSSVSSSMATPPPLPAFLPPDCPIPRLSLTAPESFSPLLYYGNFGRSSRTLPCDASHMMTMTMAMALPQAKPVFVFLSAAHRAKQPAKNPHRQTTRKRRRRDRLGTHTKHKRHTDLHSVECINPGSLDGYHSPLPLAGNRDVPFVVQRWSPGSLEFWHPGSHDGYISGSIDGYVSRSLIVPVTSTVIIIAVEYTIPGSTYGYLFRCRAHEFWFSRRL